MIDKVIDKRPEELPDAAEKLADRRRIAARSAVQRGDRRARSPFGAAIPVVTRRCVVRRGRQTVVRISPDGAGNVSLMNS